MSTKILKRKVEVVDITKATVTTLVFTAMAMFAATNVSYADSSVDSADMVTQTEVVRADTRNNDENHLFAVEFYDQSGNTVGVTIDPHSGQVVEVDEDIG